MIDAGAERQAEAIGHVRSHLAEHGIIPVHAKLLRQPNVAVRARHGDRIGDVVDDVVLFDIMALALVEKPRSEEHTSELQSLMRISYAVFCLKKHRTTNNKTN